MKLNELNLDGYKHILKNDWNKRELLLTWLNEKGFKQIGHGTFSDVWLSDGCNFVVKTGRTEDNIFKKFVGFCNSTNDPHFPKFGKLKEIDSNTFVVFMEKLYHTKFNDNLSLFLRTFSKMVLQEPSLSYKNILQEFFSVENIDENNLMYYIEEFFYFEMEIDIRGRNIIGANQINSLTKSVYNATRKMNIALYDIDDENIMQRKDGTFVFSDPIYG